MAPAELRAQLLLVGSAQDPEMVADILGAFEGAGLRPDFWGSSPGLRDPYRKEEIVAAVAQGVEMVPHVSRVRTHPPFVAHWYGCEGRLLSVHFESIDALESDALRRSFECLSGLAAALPVDFGAVDLVRGDAPAHTRMQATSSSHHIGLYRRNGPTCTFPRTFFGARVVGLLGAEVLARLGVPVVTLANGVVQMDLIEAPWTCDPLRLKQLQRRVDGALTEAGILARRASPYRHVPGPAWRAM
jgi:hypothetical protein